MTLSYIYITSKLSTQDTHIVVRERKVDELRRARVSGLITKARWIGVWVGLERVDGL